MKGKMGNQKTIKVKLTLKQTKCWDAFYNPDITHILFGGAMGGGKIVGDNNVVLTPFGFKKGKDLKVEDLINNPDGSVQKIIQIKPRITLPLWRVYFTDGTSTNVAEDHLWLSWRAEKSIKRNRNRISGEKSAEVVETKTLKEWLENGYTPQIPVCNELPFNVTTRELSAIDPYLLGVLLGDAHLGTLSLACHEDDKIYYRKVFGEEDFSYTTQGYIRIIGSLKKHIIQKLKDYSLWGTLSHTKFIPKRYKLSSITKRYEIVRGLMDTDGYSAPGKNGCYYYSTSKQLADDMAFILRSLGAVVTITNKIGSYKDKCGNKIYCKKCYCLYIKHREPDKLFKFKRKKQGYSRSSISKAVEKVEIDGNITGRCITVSNPNFNISNFFFSRVITSLLF